MAHLPREGVTGGSRKEVYMAKRSIRVLVIDDDPDFCNLLKKLLEFEQMDVETAFSGNEGLQIMYQMKPDLIILDIMMPGQNGWEVTQKIRQLTDVPILILSALSQTDDLVRSLEGGADDFVTKPFEREELLVRIRSLLRWTIDIGSTPEYAHEYDDGYLAVNLPDREISVKGKTVPLSAKEYELFEYLFLNAGRVCRTSELLDQVWGSVVPGGNRYLHVYIWKLRNKIEPDQTSPRYIQTEHGVGYRFERFSRAE